MAAMLIDSEDSPNESFALEEAARVACCTLAASSLFWVEELGTGVPDKRSGVALVAGQELTPASAAPIWNVPVDGPHKSSSIDFSGCEACWAAGSGSMLSSSTGSMMYAKLSGGARARY